MIVYVCTATNPNIYLKAGGNFLEHTPVENGATESIHPPE